VGATGPKCDKCKMASYFVVCDIVRSARQSIDVRG